LSGDPIRSTSSIDALEDVDGTIEYPADRSAGIVPYDPPNILAMMLQKDFLVVVCTLCTHRGLEIYISCLGDLFACFGPKLSCNNSTNDSGRERQPLSGSETKLLHGFSMLLP
jgi:hypothetical protein